MFNLRAHCRNGREIKHAFHITQVLCIKERLIQQKYCFGFFYERVSVDREEWHEFEVNIFVFS